MFFMNDFLCPIGTIIKKLYICDGIIWKNYITLHNNRNGYVILIMALRTL